jgi:dolichol-phosphate mannosyltransferase
MSRAGGLLIRIVLGLPVKDPTGGFKCFTRTALKKLGDFSSVRSFGYSFQMEMNWRLWKAGMRIRELPIVFSERRAGSSKISGSIAAETLKMVFRLRFAEE